MCFQLNSCPPDRKTSFVRWVHIGRSLFILYELTPGEFGLVLPLLAGERVNIEIKAIVAGNNPGWVFVDDSTQPQTALVFSHGQGGFYFAGNEENPAFFTALSETIDALTLRLKSLGEQGFDFSGTSPQWERTLESVYADRDLQQSNQYVYYHPRISQANFPQFPDGEGEIREITPELLADKEIDTTFIEKNILDWFESPAKFFRVGSGYCAVNDSKAVSLCFTSFVAGTKEVALGVYTHGDYRKRGLAKRAAIKMVERCKAEGITPFWDVMESNLASRRLAESLGLQVQYIYQVYWFKLVNQESSHEQ